VRLMKIIRYRGYLRVRVLEDRGKQSAGRRGHCLMLTGVGIPEELVEDRRATRQRRKLPAPVMVRNAVGPEATVLFIELIIKGYNELTVVV
jgi:hypothetical protein